nr:MAG TPA: hypothetical protein [Caudoviricetes sp.]
MLNPKELKEALNRHLDSGELTRALDKNRLKNIAVFFLRENPVSGMRSWAISDMQYRRLNAVYEDLGLGELKDYMRGYRYSESACTHNFSTGGGYSIFDADLLGGDADGRVLEAFKHAGLVID